VAAAQTKHFGMIAHIDREINSLANRWGKIHTFYGANHGKVEGRESQTDAMAMTVERQPEYGAFCSMH
jgi:hypothetical protein